MLTLVIGPPDCGKSRRAEALVSERSDAGNRIYLATMIPYGEEGAARVEKHRAQRAALSFRTIECPYDIAESLGQIEAPERATVLLECVSNLVANEMFGRGDDEKTIRDAHAGQVSKRDDAEREHSLERIAEKILCDVQTLAAGVRELIVVSNCYAESDGSDAETRAYIRTMDEINERLKEIADAVIEVKK